MKVPAMILCFLAVSASFCDDTISGRVVWNSVAVSGATVALGNETVTTDVDGAFSFVLASTGNLMMTRALTPAPTIMAREGTLTLSGIPLGASRLTLHRPDGRLIYSTALSGSSGIRVIPLSPSLTSGISVASLHTSRGTYAVRCVASEGGFGPFTFPVSTHQQSVHTADLIEPVVVSVKASGYDDTAVSIGAAGTAHLITLKKKSQARTTRDMWIWGSTTATSAAEGGALRAFAKEKNIGRFYLDAEGILDAPADDLADFVKKAAQEGIETELLFGAPDWTYSANHDYPIGLVERSIEIAQALRDAGEPAPVSIQFDVEPGSLPEWETDQSGIALQMIELYEKLYALCKESPLTLSACIGRNFDYVPVTRDGIERPLSEWLADVSDRITLMDYVDQGSRVINDAQNEVDYASAHGLEVVIGVETMEGLDPETVSFAEEGEAAMDAALAEAHAHFVNDPGYCGVAIHHYGSFSSW